MRLLILIAAYLMLTVSVVDAYGPPSFLPDGAHPRIILTPSTLSDLRTKMAANNADWQALVTWCDAHLNDAGYDAGNVSWDGNNTFNGYRMGGYNKYLMNFALAYQILKDADPAKAANYAAYVRNILVNGIAISLRAGEENNGLAAIRCGEELDRTINTSEAAALGITTGAYKLGYSLRFSSSVPIAYDWVHDTLSLPDQTLLSAMMYRWFDWVQGARSAYNNGVLKGGVRYHEDKAGNCTGTDNCTAYTGTATKSFTYGSMAANFMGGATYFLALAPVATYGDNADAASYLASFKSLLSSTVIDQLESSVKHSGGDSVEGWNYGGGYVYTLTGLYGYYTATGDTAVSSMTWPSALVDAMAHRLEGNLVNVPIYGDWTGTPLGVNRKYNALPFVSVLQRLTPSSTLGKVGQYLLDNASYSDTVDAWYQLLWSGNGVSQNPSALPLSHVATGNGLATSRSSWSNAADTTFLSVRLEGKAGISHEGYDEGHLTLSRGADRLLVHANMQSASNMYSTVVFNGQNHHANNPAQTAPSIDRSQEGTSYFYVSGDITNAWKRQYNTDRALLFRRSLLHIRPGFVVVYDVTRSNPAVGNLKEWYTQYGALPVVDSPNGTISATVGSSKVYTKTLYPTGGTFTADAPVANFWRVKYAPAVQQEYDQFLHVIEATGSGSGQTSAVLVDGTGGRGAVIGGITVAMFTKSQTGADVTSLSYTATTSAASTHYVADLTPGAAYSVSVDGGAAADYTASSAGVLVFSNPATSSHSYSVVQKAIIPPSKTLSGTLSGSIH